jgi:hypothetical protein
MSKNIKDSFVSTAKHLGWDQNKIIDVFCRFIKEEEMDANFSVYLYSFMMGLDSVKNTDVSATLESDIQPTEKNTVVENLTKEYTQVFKAATKL